MSFRLRMIVLAVLPFLIVTGAVTWISVKEMQSLSTDQIELVSEKLRRTKELALKDYVDLAIAAVVPVLQNTALDEKTAQREVKRILNQLSYGKDGYFFVYDNQGVNLVHPIQSELVGQNLYGRKDVRGDLVVKTLLQVSRDGGGFHQYYWNKPSTHADEQKIAYVVRLPRWNWMLGSGLYIDDINAELEVIQQQVDDNIRRNISVILLIVVLSTLLITLLMVFVNLHESRLADRRLRGLAQNFVKLQIRERRHFSRELHDGINQLMIAVKFRMELAIKQMKRGGVTGGDHASLAAGLEILTEAIREVRRISHALRPGLLDRMGLEAALQDLLDQLHERTGVDIKRAILLNPAERLPDVVEITLYRVVQEALMNIERHANATEVALELEQQPARVKLILKDDGQGFSVDEQLMVKDGIGLRNMRERVELLDGEFTIESAKGKGTRLCAVLPCNLSVQ